MGTPSPHISVIVPVYKTPLNYLKECIGSLRNQTMTEAEFILVFDGNDQELQTFCEPYKKRDCRFQIFVQPHLGVSSTRNFGINQAKGKYLVFIDADDYFSSDNALSKIYDYSVQHPCDIILHNWKEHNSTRIKHLFQQDLFQLSTNQTNNLLKNLIHNRIPTFSQAPWAKVFRKDFVIQNNISFKTNCPIGQDRVFNYEAFSKARTISYLNETLYNYRISVLSSTQKYRPNALLDLLPYIEELKEISSNSFPDLIGRETLEMFYRSWDTCYMNKQNDAPFHSRMKQLLSIVKSGRFQRLISNIDTSGLSNLARLEAHLLQKHLYFWIILHGIKHLW